MLYLKKISSEIFKGPGVLKAYATWCPHCQSKVQELNNLANRDSYKFIKDSLTNVLSYRISEAQRKPKGLEIISDGAREWQEPREVFSQPK